MALGKGVEPLGGGASLEEVSQCGQALRTYSLAPLPVYSLLPVSAVLPAGHGFCSHTFLKMMDCIPSNCEPNGPLLPYSVSPGCHEKSSNSGAKEDREGRNRLWIERNPGDFTNVS